MEHKQKSVHPRTRLISIGFALQGIGRLIRQEPNAKLHSAATLIVIAAGIIRHISKHSWLAIIFAIALVWIAEAFNTALEMLCDLCCNNEYHPKVKIIKDISAAAVLFASITGIGIGIIVFFF